MSDLSDDMLSSLGYSFIYGYTDGEGMKHELTTTTQRYCHIDPATYTDSSNRFWAYALWTYEDGSVVSSGLRYLDGSVDENFDASVFNGTYSQGSRSGSSVAIYTLDGHYMGDDLDRLAPGIYIMRITCGDQVTTRKILKD